MRKCRVETNSLGLGPKVKNWCLLRLWLLCYSWTWTRHSKTKTKQKIVLLFKKFPNHAKPPAFGISSTLWYGDLEFRSSWLLPRSLEVLFKIDRYTCMQFFFFFWGGRNGYLSLIYKLHSKMSIFFKFDFNKIELQMELDISNVKFYAYFAT